MQPNWLAKGQAQAHLALRLLRNASAHGLDPRRYGTEGLARRLDTLSGAEAAAAFERDLNTGMLQFLADLHFGRLHSAYRQPSGTPGQFDPVTYLIQAVKTGRLEQAVEAAAPAIPLYHRVQQSLAEYRELADLYPEWPPLPSVPSRGIVAGALYDGAALLRERLQLLGDLDPEADAITGSDIVYTTALAIAVQRFQLRHGLVENGVLTPRTLNALEIPMWRRVRQLELTLERLRWLPPLPAGRFVAVNLPTYRLWGFETHDKTPEPLVEMRVIVGTAARTPTPLFIGQMRYLEFNPYWNVPRSIEAGEILPKLVRNPGYLRQNDMELVTAGGAVLPEGAADAAALLRAGTARVRQRPGPGNVLGALKFAMPNPMNIYLHSTSAQELFKRTRRDLSHGCIRVEHPNELAEFVLADALKWDAIAVQAAIAEGRTRTVPLPVPVPVILFYATAVTDRDGRALFAEDIYRRDAPLIEALRATSASPPR
jgi:murein L,D-transpeptidase YcbB/YkuD